MSAVASPTGEKATERTAAPLEQEEEDRRASRVLSPDVEGQGVVGVLAADHQPGVHVRALHGAGEEGADPLLPHPGPGVGRPPPLRRARGQGQEAEGDTCDRCPEGCLPHPCSSPRRVGARRDHATTRRSLPGPSSAARSRGIFSPALPRALSSAPRPEARCGPGPWPGPSLNAASGLGSRRWARRRPRRGRSWTWRTSSTASGSGRCGSRTSTASSSSSRRAFPTWPPGSASRSRASWPCFPRGSSWSKRRGSWWPPRAA